MTNPPLLNTRWSGTILGVGDILPGLPAGQRYLIRTLIASAYTTGVPTEGYIHFWEKGIRFHLYLITGNQTFPATMVYENGNWLFSTNTALQGIGYGTGNLIVYVEYMIIGRKLRDL